MKRELFMKNKVFMVGAFPPPVHGMSAVNSTVYKLFVQSGIDPVVIDMGSGTLNRTIRIRISRLVKVLRACIKILKEPNLKGQPLYMSVSMYDFPVVIAARIRGMRLYLHHHVFLYLDRYKFLAKMFFLLAGNEATHITLCNKMGELLKAKYRLKRIERVSNSVFFGSSSGVFSKNGVIENIGYISNISEEKGIYEFIHLFEELQRQGCQVNAYVAGPFENIETEREVKDKIDNNGAIHYVGAKYGEGKDQFFQDIDVLVFPTKYKNEAESLIVHEAMRVGVPVAVYGRGCLSEIVESAGGIVVPRSFVFDKIAAKEIIKWINNPTLYNEACENAVKEYNDRRAKSQAQWDSIFKEMCGV
jgi:glycosyltransferase involved in cell wall biosynthesis